MKKKKYYCIDRNNKKHKYHYWDEDSCGCEWCESNHKYCKRCGETYDDYIYYKLTK